MEYHEIGPRPAPVIMVTPVVLEKLFRRGIEDILRTTEDAEFLDYLFGIKRTVPYVASALVRTFPLRFRGRRQSLDVRTWDKNTEWAFCDFESMVAACHAAKESNSPIDKQTVADEILTFIGIVYNGYLNTRPVASIDDADIGLFLKNGSELYRLAAENAHWSDTEREELILMSQGFTPWTLLLSRFKENEVLGRLN